jgi:hypothetical protein
MVSPDAMFPQHSVFSRIAEEFLLLLPLDLIAV